MTDRSAEFIANGNALEQLRDTPLDQVTLRRVFLLLTRVHYADPSNYGILRQTMKNFKWAQDPAKSTIKVELDFKYDPALTDIIPSIFVGTGDIDYTQTTVDSREGSTRDRSGATYAIQAGAYVILRHVSTDPDECLKMSAMSFDFYAGIRELIMEKLKLSAFMPTQTSTPRFFMPDAAEKAKKTFASDLKLKVGFTPAWTTFRESHRIKAITLGSLMTDFSLPGE